MSKPKTWRQALAAGVAVVFLAGCGAPEEVKINHIHGAGYSPDGKQLYVANHGAFLVHEEDGWLPPVNKHDFMGISLTEKGMYVSGHPAQGSSMRNPLGLSKSTDGGESVEPLALYGERDFYVMAASYREGTVYVWNDQMHHLMPQGLNYTTDEGKSWTNTKMKGLRAEATALAVHPDQDEVIAFGTPAGVEISADHGETVPFLFDGVKNVTALYFDLQKEDVLWVANHTDKPRLYRVTGYKALLKENQPAGAPQPQVEEVFSLDQADDAIMTIASNPETGAVALVTHGNQILESTDGGKTFTKLEENGVVKMKEESK